MSCTSPLYAWNTGRLTAKGRPLYFVTRFPGAPNIQEVNKRLSFELDRPLLESDPLVRDGHLTEMVNVPCGRCAACYSARTREWSRRCMIEASKYSQNYFVTLTYDDEHYKIDLLKSELSGFVKRLRKYIGPGIRFFGCGERGSRTGRNHFHIILFNCPLDDLRVYSSSENPLYTSETVSKAWQRKGMALIGSVTPESCAYVARYCVKKRDDRDDSFILMSRRPGIAADFFDDNIYQILRTDKVYFPFSEDEHMAAPPRYFTKRCEKAGLDIEGHKQLRVIRADQAKAAQKGHYHVRTDEELNAIQRSLEKRKERRLKVRRGL